MPSSSAAGDALGHHPTVAIGNGHVDLKLVSVVELGLDTGNSAAVAAGGTVVDDSNAPSLTVTAAQDGNRGVLCVAEPPTTKG